MRKEEQPVPNGAIRVYLTAGKFAERREIGYVEDLSYLPDLLENTADELRCMMIEQHMRQEAEKIQDD